MGAIISITRKTMYDMSFLSATTAKDVVLHPALDVSGFYRVRVIVRVHSLTIANPGSFEVIAQNTLPSEEDPKEFTDTSSFLAVSITGASPPIQSATATDPQAFLKILLRATQGSVSGSALYGEFSVVVVGRQD